ncbi:hypothetical protein ACWOQH_000699 [Vibrio parahaemolyticus]
MKAKYKFPIYGEIKLEPNQMLPIKETGYIYEFVIDERCIVTHIEVTVPVQEQWYPKLVKTAPNYHQLITDNPAFYFVHRNLRGIEVLMSLWGLKYIDKRNFDITWLPETQEEEIKLNIKNFSIKSERISIEDIEPLPFDLAARAIIKSWDGAEESVIASFYRKGTIDMESQDYIDAIYDFYLILESRFGDGKWRGKQIKQILKCSNELKEAFKHATTKSLNGSLSRKLLDKRDTNKAYKHYEDFIDHIVDLRGQLHHHSEKNKRSWNPNKQEDYELDARYLHAICNHIIFNMTWRHIDEESVKLDYENQCAEFIAKHS